MISPPNISRIRVTTRAGKRLKQFLGFKHFCQYAKLAISSVGSFFGHFLPIFSFRVIKKNGPKTFQKRCNNERVETIVLNRFSNLYFF